MTCIPLDDINEEVVQYWQNYFVLRYATAFVTCFVRYGYSGKLSGWISYCGTRSKLVGGGILRNITPHSEYLSSEGFIHSLFSMIQNLLRPAQI